MYESGWIKDNKEKWGLQLTEEYLFCLKAFKFNLSKALYMCTHTHIAHRLPVYTSDRNDVYHLAIWNLKVEDW